MNAVDESLTYALDKRSGQGDILQSVVVCASAGRIISSVQTGPNSDVTWHPNGGNMIVRVPTLTAARSYTLGHSGATGGDRLSFYVEGTGASPSGYVDIKNNVGTGLFRLGMVRTGTGCSEYAEGDNAEFIFVGSGWQLMKGAGPGMKTITFLSDAVWICPPGVHKIMIFGCGGGGGGAGGVANSTSANRWVAGGGGGGGALHQHAVVDVIPGKSYQIAIGSGGSAGPAGIDGSEGGSTTLYPLIEGPQTNSPLFVGGQGGKVWLGSTGQAFGISATGHYRSHGGGPVQTAAWRGWGNFANNTVMDSIPSGISSFGSHLAPASGGDGNGLGTGTSGQRNLTGDFVGGVGGAKGADSGTERGGGGGGGGAAGPFGTGGAGGAGGAGGGANNGSAGSSAADNTGGGGGGGGSGGCAAAGSGAGASGGNGGSGRLTLVYIK